jgi:tetratricopeptide (TPR) repeat protein
MNTPFTDLRICRSLLLMLLACCTIADYSAQAFVRQDEAASEEESVQIKTAERFLSVLEKNPRYGTALDRVYGHHVEFGSLDKFLNSLNERAQKQTDNGALWMMLGMFESQRGGDAAAVEALTQADKLRAQDGLASFYLGQAQLRIGQSEEAIQSFERAISRKPPRADLLEIFQTLGRVHQRAQRTDEAMRVWQRLEELFPSDPRVLEQIAVTLAEEGQSALALPRYQKLAELERDDYRKVIFQVTAAGLTIKTGKKDDGIKQLENVLSNLNPESWLYRDVRRRIEDVFLRSGDQDSLVKYYQRWLEGHPEDVEGMTRLARFLASSARVPEAIQWMEKALKLAPSRSDLRKSFIDQLVEDQRITDALAQYEQLVKSQPGNPDFLRDWGKLALRNREISEDARKKQATEIWNRMLTTRPNDALTVSQVADLFRQNKMNDEAEKLYKNAVELAPGDPQYREYLGEFLHIQKRSNEALAVWQEIAAGNRRNAVNITRLAEIYNSFGFPDKAVVEVAEAVKLDPKDLGLLIRAADYHSKAGKYDEAIAYVESAKSIAANDDEQDAVIQQRIEVLQVSQRLEPVANELLAKLRGSEKADEKDWYLAARYLEASRRWPEANEAVNNAMKINPKSIPSMTLAAKIAETSGDMGRASEISRSLADTDRRSRGDHLMNVSRLESQLGRANEALKAAQELIVSAPGKTENYEFYAQTCFRLGRVDEGLENLRKAVRIHPNEPHLLTALASALAEQLRTEEAIEVYWRAFEKADEVEDKVGVTTKLAQLYQQINQFDKLVARFERDRREEDKRRESTICLAQAWQTGGDFTSARQELESLLSEDTRDTNLLNQLAKLCQSASDLDAAIGYQRQLVAIAPGHETEFPLAGMLMSGGQVDEAREIFVRLTAREEDAVRQMKSLDSLISQGDFASAIEVIEPLLAQNREDWELLYREGLAWASLDKPDEAVNRFQRILALKAQLDSLGRSANEKLKQAQAKAKSDNLRGLTSPVPQKQTPLEMLRMSQQVQRATRLVSDNRYYGSGQSPPTWMPESFGLARMAALGWLIHFEEEAARSPLVDSKGAASSVAEKAAESNEKPSVSIIDLVRERAAAEGASRDSIYDWLFVAQLKNDFPAIFQMARRMAKGGGKEEQNFFLTSLSMRSTDEKSLQISNNSGEPQTAKRPALDPDDIQLMLDCFNRLNQNKTDEDSTVAYGNIIYSGGQAYVQVGNTYYPLSSFTGGAHLATVIEELRFAGKSEDALKLLNDHLGKATKSSELSSAMAILHKEKRNEELLQYFDRWQQAAIKTIAEAPVTAQQSRSPGRTQGQAGQQLQQVLPTIQVWMGELGAEEENAQLATILDECLAVADEEAKYRAKVKALNPKSATRVTQSGVSQIAVYYGKNQTYSNLTFPPANEWLDYPSIVLLYQVHEVFKKNDVMSDLADQLRKRQDDLSNAGADDERLLRNSLCLASALWWAEEKDEATEWMAKALSYGSKDMSLQFALAGMYQERNDFEDALNIVEAIAPSDQRILQQRELMALSLAERIGDTDRARSAAERLFGLRLDAQTQISLVDRMKRLGLNSLADAVMARAERSTSSNQSSSLASLMMLYQGQGKTEQAIQVAHILLRKTPSPVSITQRTGRNPLRYQNSDSSTRTRALQLLQQSGELKKIIEGLENQLTRSPGAILPLQQLIEYYEVAGQKDEVQKKIQQALEVRPDSPMLRLQLAKQLEKTGKTNEACDQYLELLKIQPNWVTEELYQVDRLFTQAKRKTELVKALGLINLKQVSQPYYLINTASRLLQEESSAPIGLAMLEKIFDAFPQYRNNMMQGFEGDAVWKAEGVYKFVKRAILPSEQDIQTNPWIGLNQVYSYSSDGNVDVMFHRILRGLRASDKLKDLSESIADLIEKHPGWYSGRAMLALIELNSDRKQEALERLKLLAGDEKIAKTMLPDTCWIIGQELDKFTETRDLAIELFERAVASGARGSQSQMQYSPIVKLIEHYSKSGQKEKARQLLLNKLSQASFDQYDQQYAAAQRVQNATWAAGKLQSMDMPIDALRLYRGLIDKQNDLAFANQWNGNQPDYYEKMVRKGLNDSLTSISSKNSDQAIAELLRVDKKDSAKKDSGVNAIDLMVSFPDAQALQKDEIKSAFVDLLKNLSKESAMAERVSAKLDELASHHPDDFSVLTCVALWKLSMKREDAVSAVKQLVLAASDRPLEQIPEGRRPNSRQRRQAAQLIPLWLVARECIGSKELNDEGLKLAEICKAAAKRQLGNKEQSVILYDWGNLLLKAGRKDEAEARWTELLELTVDRPAPKAVAPKTSMRLPSNNRGELQHSGISLFHALVPHASLTMLQQTAPKPPASARPPSSRLPPPTSAKAIQESDQANEKKSNRIPPLTISQFRTAMLVARAAAQNGMAELSRKAIRESLKGGFPIPDPESTPAGDNPFGSTRVIRRSDQPTAVNSLDQEVVKSLKEIVALWSGAEYPSQDRYELLKALVLPDNRPQEIRLYVNAQAYWLPALKVWRRLLCPQPKRRDGLKN